jgi:hypothetical protein
MVYFINGGTASTNKAGIALPAALKIAADIATSPVPLWYVDEHVKVRRAQYVESFTNPS